jgi:hypothetical protein
MSFHFVRIEPAKKRQRIIGARKHVPLRVFQRGIGDVPRRKINVRIFMRQIFPARLEEVINLKVCRGLNKACCVLIVDIAKPL